MSNIKIIFQLFCLLFLSCSEQEDYILNSEESIFNSSLNITGEDNTLDIVTWNIENFPKNNLTNMYVKQIIDSLNIDIIGLQEIESLSYFNNLLEIFKIWNGGMSFHGGFIGVVIAVIYSSKTYKISLMIFSDLISIVSPIGIFFGRIANFINGELYGKVTNHKFGMIFPKGGSLPRHPSQLYEAFLEGLLLFVILWLLMNMSNFFDKKGLITGCFIFLYGIFRFFVEFLREPDFHIGNLYLDLSMGQLLSLPMIIIGLYFIKKFYNRTKI